MINRILGSNQIVLCHKIIIEINTAEYIIVLWLAFMMAANAKIRVPQIPWIDPAFSVA